MHIEYHCSYDVSFVACFPSALLSFHLFSCSLVHFLFGWFYFFLEIYVYFVISFHKDKSFPQFCFRVEVDIFLLLTQLSVVCIYIVHALILQSKLYVSYQICMHAVRVWCICMYIVVIIMFMLQTFIVYCFLPRILCRSQVKVSTV